MLNLRDRNRGTSARLIPAGTYFAEVLSVDWCDSDKYGPEGAYEVIYRVFSDDNRQYRHREVFLNDMENKRTRDFENHVADSGIEILKDIEGKRVILTFKHESKNGTMFSNIISREFCHDDE